jgi:hypothetical protein
MCDHPPAALESRFQNNIKEMARPPAALPAAKNRLISRRIWPECNEEV